VLKEFRWEAQLAEADLFNRWAELVGQQNADNSQPETLVGGVLTIRCKSTAWATQLRLMQAILLEKVTEAHPDLEIKSLKLLGPDAPSWKKGPRSVPGRGPRDTYG
jgi:predicted nucleic acid-binding Zn ribbon protein